ncbi:taste receptor type 2 member 1 [Sciurus carolinensis]|uniref:taste receptor type 2 member 1 n=1 Tax=Sciurus carolinensis TaxID=30640 RepID=UPI001FB50C71|nr:taste receptor type 2 member 1 [Sciurus carolinensis]
MSEAHFIFFLLCTVTQSMTGVFANGIIVVANGIALVRQRRLASLDLLLSCLAMTRICMQVLIFGAHLVTLSLLKPSVFIETFLILIFINKLGLWLATWLGVFYCAKISTIPHSIFFWLKMRISKLVPWLILGSLLHVSITCGIHGKYMWPFSKEELMAFFSENRTKIKDMHSVPFYLFIAEHILPLLIFLVAVLLLIFSLGRHTQQMRAIAVGTREPCRSPHVSALFSILSFLILYFSHYAVSILFFTQIFQFGSHPFLFCLMVAGAYPAGHSIILILGNAKLKQNVKMFFLHGKCCQ